MTQMMKDPYGVWTGEKFQFTLDKLCRIINGGKPMTLPPALAEKADRPVARVAADTMVAKSGLRVVFDLSWNVDEKESYNKIAAYLKAGVVAVTNRKYSDAKGNPYPVIEVKDPWEAWIALGRYVKDVLPMPTIGITGSAGKTTSTMFAECVFNERYNTFVSGLDGRNFNTALQIVNQWILRSGPQYTFHVQECGAETPRLVESSARIINCDAFGITNIDTSQHIATYGTPENLIADKTSFDRVRNDHTVGVINKDDKILRDFPFKSPLITYAIDDETADFVGKNIVQNDELLEFDVVSREDTVHLRIHIVGKHNVYNALMVFALARHFGLSNEEIQRGFYRYESVGIRQYLRRVGGRLLYMDAYNASVESTQLAITALQELHVATGGRRIAIIGERNTSSEETYEINYELGRSLAKYEGIDEFIIVGPDPRRITGHPVVIAPENRERYTHALYNGACSVMEPGNHLSYCNNLAVLAQRLRFQTKAGDAILFKGRHQLSLWCIADMAFGTAYTKTPALVPLNPKKTPVATKSVTGEDYAYFDGINLLTAVNGFDNTRLVLPNAIEKRFIVRINDGAFENQSQLRSVVFGTRVRAIGDRAFADCTNLEQLDLPKSCFYVGIESFAGCRNLVRANLLGTGHVSRSAFRDCANLRQVMLGDKCGTIEDGAFDGCPDLTVWAPADSYAARWAAEHNVPWQEIDAQEELEKLAKNGTRLLPAVYGLERFEPEQPVQRAPERADRADISVVVAGDIMVHDEELRAHHNRLTDSYDFHKYFANTSRYFKAADLTIGNVETVFGPGPYMGFPRFNTPDALIEAMVQAGLQVSASANNHIYDGKYPGIVRTKRVLKEGGMEVAGIRENPEDKAYVVVERQGVKIAIINFTYCSPSIGGNKTINNQVLDANSLPLINCFSTETLDEDLKAVDREILRARREGAQVVLVYYHWGSEFERSANVLQKYIAYRTACMGADAILGSHSHVLQEMSSVTVTEDGAERTVPVFYGMGNYSWAARMPRLERETVQHGALGLLNIHYDKENRKLLSIDTDYVPLYIKGDYIYNHYDYNVLSLRDMAEEEIAAFNLRSSSSVQQIMGEIDDTMRGRLHTAPVTARFDRVVEIPAGEVYNAAGNILPADQLACLRSENATVAFALPGGDIVAAAAGYAGMTAVRTDGSELCFVVKVTGEAKTTVLPLVDENNTVPDIYRPIPLAAGADYGLTAGISLEKKTAEAWRTMQLAAANDGIYLRCISGFRTNETQLRKLVALQEGRYEPDTRFMPLGHSEHQLGTALDVTNVAAGTKKSLREDALAWLDSHAADFGFLMRKPTHDRHRHLRFVGSARLAQLMTKRGVTVASFIEKKADLEARLARETAWMSRYLPEEEIDAPRESWDTLTLRRICAILDMPVPDSMQSFQDRIVPRITMSDLHMVPGSVFVLDRELPNSTPKCRNALRDGAAFAITDFNVNDALGRPLPQLRVPNAMEACIALANHIRSRFPGKVVAVAEEADRRLMRDIMNKFLSRSFRVYQNVRSVDNRINMLYAIEDLSGAYDVALQNVRTPYAGYTRTAARMLQPDMAIFGLLDEEKPEKFGTYQDYLAEKTSLADITLERGGTVLMNRNAKEFAAYFDRPGVVTYSGKNRKANYFLVKTEEQAHGLMMTVRKNLNGVKTTVQVLTPYRKSPVYSLAAFAARDLLLQERGSKQ